MSSSVQQFSVLRTQVLALRMSCDAVMQQIDALFREPEAQDRPRSFGGEVAKPDAALVMKKIRQGRNRNQG